MKQARENDLRAEKGEPPPRGAGQRKVLVWPDLVYVEFISLILAMALMIVWSLFLKAPLEEPANPTVSPNPSRHRGTSSACRRCWSTTTRGWREWCCRR